jgi:5'-AMP-activated protein kinase regulatory beta subunit
MWVPARYDADRGGDMSRATTTGKKWVRFEITALTGSRVFVAGSFNDWDPVRTPLAEERPGVFGATVLLPKGHHEYKLVVNGEWRCDPSCADWVPNRHGTLNSRLQVG